MKTRIIDNQKKKLIWMISFIFISLVIVITMHFYAPNDIQPVDNKTITVALSKVEKNNPRLTKMINSFESASDARNVKFIYHEPKKFTIEWQLEDVNSLLKEGIDYLVLAPREITIIDDILAMADKYNTPVILLSSQVEEEMMADVVSSINTDFVKEGKVCAKILAEKYNGKMCRIIEVRGIQGSSIAMERAVGFRMEMANHPNMVLVDSIQGNFDRVSAQESMETVIVTRTDEFDAVFAHSDEDGIGVLNAMKVSGYLDEHKVDIVSVDGVQDVFKAIIAKEYLATVYSNAKLGDVAFDIIGQMERGFKPSKSVFIPYAIINEDNAEVHLQLTY